MEVDQLQAALKELGYNVSLAGLSQTERDIVRGLLVGTVVGDFDQESAAHALWDADYRERPVDVRTFITGKDYLAMAVTDTEEKHAGVFPAWLEVLEEFFAPSQNNWELILTGGIGTGKSSAAILAMLYKLYRLSCLKDPHNFYGVMPGHPIVFGLYNVFKFKAYDTAFQILTAAIERSPYFKDVFPRNQDKTTVVQFPNNIRFIVGAEAIHALGENLFGVLIDETDFMKAGATATEKGQAHELYDSTRRRIESRFMRRGDVPGLVTLVSSKTIVDSFIEKRVKAAGRGSFSADRTLWQVKPWRYSGATFAISVGDTYSTPRIITDVEVDSAEGRVIRVPVEHREAFEADMLGAMRDIAGESTTSENPFIPERDAVFKCVDKTRVHPFRATEFSITVDDNAEINDYFNPLELLVVERSFYRPKVRPMVERYIHLDLGITNDCVGISMVHLAGTREVTRVNTEAESKGFTYITQAPVFYVDFILRVIPKVGTRIDLQKIRNFVFALRDYGFAIGGVTQDGFNAEDSQQQFIKSGFDAEVVSVDKPKPKDGHPYSYLRQALLEDRISYYYYAIMIAELLNLRKEIVIRDGQQKWLVDHPVEMFDVEGNKIRGSKDTTDSLAGAVFAAATKGVARAPLDPPPTPQTTRPIDRLKGILGDYKDHSRIRGIV